MKPRAGKACPNCSHGPGKCTCIPLTPPDPKRCQTEVPNGYTFMTFGGAPGLVRCSNKASFFVYELVVFENKKDKRLGSMSMCNSCLAVFIHTKKGRLVNYRVEVIK